MQPPVSSTENPSTIDIFSPENDDKDIVAKVQSAKTTDHSEPTEQDGNQLNLPLSALKQQWELAAALSVTTVALLGLIWIKHSWVRIS